MRQRILGWKHQRAVAEKKIEASLARYDQLIKKRRAEAVSYDYKINPDKAPGFSIKNALKEVMSDSEISSKEKLMYGSLAQILLPRLQAQTLHQVVGTGESMKSPQQKPLNTTSLNLDNVDGEQLQSMAANLGVKVSKKKAEQLIDKARNLRGEQK